jgi:choice-of-anchor C domain-containing protein
MSFLRSAVLVGFAVGAAVAAKADIVNNGTFSPIPSGTFTTLPSGSTAISGWTVTGNSVDWIGSYWQAPPSGDASIDLDGSGAGGVKQTINGLTNGASYTLSFEFSGNPTPHSPDTPVKTLNVSVGSVSNQQFTFDTTGHSTTDMGWELESFIFQGTGLPTTLLFASQDAAGSATGPAIADVSITANSVTPEPGFYGVLALGLAALAFAVVRSRQRA